jgi:hypothetical protein
VVETWTQGGGNLNTRWGKPEHKVEETWTPGGGNLCWKHGHRCGPEHKAVKAEEKGCKSQITKWWKPDHLLVETWKQGCGDWTQGSRNLQQVRVCTVQWKSQYKAVVTWTHVSCRVPRILCFPKLRNTKLDKMFSQSRGMSWNYGHEFR